MSIPVKKIEEIIDFLDNNHKSDLSIYLKEIIENVEKSDFRFVNIMFDKQEQLILIFEDYVSKTKTKL